MKDSQLKFVRELFWVIILPLSFLWAWVAVYRRKLIANKLPRSEGVVCVGNIHSGGSGKTPIVAAIAERYASRNLAVVFRGYKGTLINTALLDRSDPLGPKKYGDEAWMLAHRVTAPIWVGKNRLQTVMKLSDSTLALVDDGYQNFSLLPRVRIVVVNVRRALSDLFCLPLGDLREPVGALAAADLIVLTSGEGEKNDCHQWQQFLSEHFSEIQVYVAERRWGGLWDSEGQVDSGGLGPVFGFSGIASPERFYSDLEQRCTVLKRSLYPDHYDYSSIELKKIIQRADEAGCERIVTTEKDWFKAKRCVPPGDKRLLYAKIHYDLSTHFWKSLDEKLGHSSAN